MHTHDQIEAAVAAGAIDEHAAGRLRHFIDADKPADHVDEENIRLVTSFNDIFVSIAIVLVLVASSVIAGAALIAAVCWGLAEFFTRKRRMALPSVILAVVFSAAVFVFAAQILGQPLDFFASEEEPAINPALLIAAMGIITAAATGAYWMRFKAPVSVACGTVAVAVALLSIIMIPVGGIVDEENIGTVLTWLSLTAGIAIFAFAMWWDMRDLARVTRRSDVAFWLHLAASPLIVHPIFLNLGVAGSAGDTTGAAIIAVIAYLGLGIIAVIVDRRAILVSALAYVLAAMSVLINSSETGAASFAVPAAIIGGLLLMLSAFWQPLRRALMSPLPVSWKNRLPVIS